ncbi:dihydrodipicolinate reductase [Schaalia cardiffensis F0333]|uniref:4-hydroxy-tetrahydrodipicolinate reductase n=1 Tax=Schaalia cardiffensis F0333 TaxID=888050 RepID=N6XDG7_9ACTO|nr:4-hydroxy-tetrahydrodipicolinate reductase [Schaalia cardiffensis]ENO19258.1 dihydrodipicolinate reductase [Schaalia cardiffensis F0333]
MTIRVAVTGAKGRMGSTVVEAVRAAEGMELVAALDAEDEISPESLNAAEVAVDFSIPSVTESNVHALLDAGVDVVVGTTGWTEESYERVRVHAEELGRAVLIAPNFAMGAVLAMKFAALAAPYFESAEVIEMHHPNKVDAPSGTAIATARGIGAARKGTGLDSMPDATQSDPEGTRGGLIDGVPVHAVRLRGLTASEEILLGNPGEQLVIRTDSFDRVSFMPGVILAIRSIRGRVGLTIGLDKILDI